MTLALGIHRRLLVEEAPTSTELLEDGSNALLGSRKWAPAVPFAKDDASEQP
jgi:hypothetical protein